MPLYKALARWAKKESRAIANLAGRILEDRIEEADKAGEIPPEQTDASADDDATALIRLIAEKGELTTEAIARAARAAKVSPMELGEVLEKLKNGNGEKTAKS